MIYINDKEVNLIYNLGEKVKEVFSYGTKIWPKEVLFDYMYFKLADGYTSGNVSYKFDEYFNLHNKYLKISTDGNNWNDWTEAISMVPNTKYFVKGEDSYVRNSDITGGFFTSDVSTQNFNIECGGNVMSLCNMNENITTNYCFCSLFYEMKNLLTPPTLPATTLSLSCYAYMFYGCSKLVHVSALPATTLANYCYQYMFRGCSSLTQAPVLPATTLTVGCYYGMLYDCSSLTQAPILPATTLVRNCYNSMFYGCSKLVHVSALPATTLENYCYQYMFSGCSSLTQAPVLPATTLTVGCYYGMFSGCSSLTQAPALPATTLARNCYNSMFQNCSSLTQVPSVLQVIKLENYCYQYMFSGCSSLTQAPALPATTLTVGCYYGMFSDCSSLTQAPELPATTLNSNCYYQMFNGCTSLTEITLNGDFNSSYSTNWVSNVSPSGTFYNNSDLDIPVGVNGIPSGWKDIRPVKLDYMYFKLADGAESGNVSYQFNEYYNLHNKYLKYRTDGSNWQDWTESISMSQNTKYYVKGEDNYVRNSKIHGGFFSSDVSTQNFNIECGGNIMSMCNMATEITTNYCFRTLFQHMTNLVTPPKLPATTLASYCYQNMFQGCTSLTEAHELPATTLADYCYNAMFQGCTSLTQAPELPATTLSSYCYSNMFNGCSSLTQAPELPATTLSNNCYHYMFLNSNKLNWIKAIFTTTPSTSYTKNWVNGVSSQGVFVKNINATWTDTGVNAVPTGWTVIYFDQTEGKYYTTKTKEVECDKYGNVKADYMYFKLADGYTSGNVSYKFDEYFNLHNKYLKYSTDGNNWQDWNETISMVPNVKYYVKGEDNYVRNSDISGGFFSSDVSTQQFNIECGGNIMSLVNMNENITVNSCFSSLFYEMKNLLTPPALPATTLSDSCYYYMFCGCSSLTQAPALPATTLAEGCYGFMFFGCFKLVQAPELPATTLTDYCYSAMFYNSNKLNWIKALFTTKPSSLYTTSWVNIVSSQGVFVKNIDATWKDTGADSVPERWKVIYFDQTEGKYYTTQTKEVECDKYGNPLV